MNPYHAQRLVVLRVFQRVAGSAGGLDGHQRGVAAREIGERVHGELGKLLGRQARAEERPASIDALMVVVDQFFSTQQDGGHAGM